MAQAEAYATEKLIIFGFWVRVHAQNASLRITAPFFITKFDAIERIRGHEPVLHRGFAVLPFGQRCRNYQKLRLWRAACGWCCRGGGLRACV